MKSTWAWVKGEPAVLLSLVAALITLGAAFGLKLTAEQTSAVTAVVEIVVGILTRTVVTPTSKVVLPPVVFSSDNTVPH